jgi:class 3 adenylate cyclase
MAQQATQPNDEPPMQRRLATILSADVAGYSRLIGDNEEETVKALRGHRAVFDSLLKQHHGRVFNTAGDAILAEFPSAVEAVRCATEIQSALQTRNEHLPPEQKMLFRMGINLGDVVVQEGDLLGDGVNVAARIQTLAEPGGICISGSVYDQIQNKLSLRFKALGGQKLKNIGQPVRTFTITHVEEGVLPASSNPRLRKSAPVIAIVLVVALFAIGGGYFLYRQNEATHAEQAALAAQLAAEKKAAEDARHAADEQGRRAAEAESQVERERLASAAAKREAALQAQLQTSEEARRRAEADRKRMDDERARAEAERKRIEEERQRAEAEKREADARAAQTAKGRQKNVAGKGAMAGAKASDTVAAATPSGAASTSTASSPSNAPNPAPSGNAVTKFDGAYAGQLCNFPGDPDRKFCWKVRLNVANGVADAAWPSRVAGRITSARFSIDANGLTRLAIEGWNEKTGNSNSALLIGRLTDDRIDATGSWATGAQIEGHWTRAR